MSLIVYLMLGKVLLTIILSILNKTNVKCNFYVNFVIKNEKGSRIFYDIITDLRKVQDCLTKLAFFSFCPAKTFSLSDKCPMYLSKENNILTTKLPSVLQILICPAKVYSLTAVLHQ